MQSSQWFKDRTGGVLVTGAYRRRGLFVLGWRAPDWLLAGSFFVALTSSGTSAQPLLEEMPANARSAEFLRTVQPERMNGFASSEARLGFAVAASARQSIAEQGVAAARQALLDCQKGDYPGGGMGVLSMPFQRPSAITDHCRR
jgi:hypothetical protein